MSYRLGRIKRREILVALVGWQWFATALFAAATPATFPMISTGSGSSGVATSLALAADGTVWAWGTGLLGNGSASADAMVPELVVALHDVVGISAGSSHSLVVKSDGSVWGWGHNDAGELGTGDRNERLAPILVEGLDNVVAVAAGHSHSLALKGDGTVWRWGGFDFCRQGTFAWTNPNCRPSPVAGLSGVRAISAGSEYSLVLKEDGTIWGWGKNDGCQLGDGTTLFRSDPVQVPGLTDVVSVSASDSGRHSLAVTREGTVWWWGSQYGRAKTQCSPVAVAGIGGVKAVTAGGETSALLKTDGTVWRLHADSNTTPPADDWEAPIRVGKLDGVEFVDAGGNQAMALRDDGSVWVWWGENNPFFSTQPTQLPGSSGEGYFNLYAIPTGNAAPVAHDFYRSMDSGTTLAGQLSGGDAEDEPLAFSVVDNPVQGSLTLAADGAFRYTPPPGFMGNATFRYRVNDGQADSAPATATVIVVDCTLRQDAARRAACSHTLYSECDLDGDGRPDYYDRAIYGRHCRLGPLHAPIW